MKWILLGTCLLWLNSCAPDAHLLEGAWRACGYYQEGQSIAAPLDSVGLVLNADQTYEFRSIGFYREKGSFRVSSHYLFLLDSTENEARERALKILFVSPDSLKLKMQVADKEQVLFLSRMP